MKLKVLNPKIPFLVLALAASTRSIAQEKVWVTQVKVSKIIAYEKKIGSGMTYDYAGYRDDMYPSHLSEKYQLITHKALKIERWPAAASELGMYIECWFTPGDSIVRMMTYDWLRFYESKYSWAKGSESKFSSQQWDQLQAEERDICKEENGKPDFYKKELARIKKLVRTKLGPPTTANNTTYVWDTEGCRATLYLVFFEHNHLIRLEIYWKK